MPPFVALTILPVASLRIHGLTPFSLAEGSGDRKEPVPKAGNSIKMLTC